MNKIHISQDISLQEIQEKLELCHSKAMIKKLTHIQSKNGRYNRLFDIPKHSSEVFYENKGGKAVTNNLRTGETWSAITTCFGCDFLELIKRLPHNTEASSLVKTFKNDEL
jgi:hypothetical protein